MKRSVMLSSYQRPENRLAYYLSGTRIGLCNMLIILSLLVSFVGCAPLYTPTEAERTAVSAGGKALVLLRIQCTVDEQPYEPFISPTFTVEPIIALGLGTFATVGEPRYVVHRFLSDASRQAGWTYFILSPGAYYLAVLGPDSSVSSQMGSANAQTYLQKTPRWRLDIPEGAGLIYIGTLQLKGKTEGMLLFGGKIIRPANGDELVVRNEAELAERLLAEHFPGAGEVKIILMERWRPGDPVIIRTPKRNPHE